ncbi:hypothetical protein RchiOBHm_Chr1g0332811 [Rosa chinensis]|uniref:Uncharacterized protein n=1 Tax=Rosa chinensis TaxID=74649 RepID=A0A2P6SBZ2_ROSCH|nr:hypothetical protein RchiOBHm_Chr1g0332811 [Rosa chinensis]
MGFRWNYFRRVGHAVNLYDFTRISGYGWESYPCFLYSWDMGKP